MIEAFIGVHLVAVLVFKVMVILNFNMTVDFGDMGLIHVVIASLVVRLWAIEGVMNGVLVEVLRLNVMLIVKFMVQLVMSVVIGVVLGIVRLFVMEVVMILTMEVVLFRSWCVVNMMVLLYADCLSVSM